MVESSQSLVMADSMFFNWKINRNILLNQKPMKKYINKVNIIFVLSLLLIVVFGMVFGH